MSAPIEITAECAAIESSKSHAPIARLLRESARKLVHQAQDLEHFGGRAAHMTACSKLREAARLLFREADAQEAADSESTLGAVGRMGGNVRKSDV